jgi:hypothetical protein
VQNGACGSSRFDGALQRLALILRGVRPDAECSGIDPATRCEFARHGGLVGVRRRCGGPRGGGPGERGKQAAAIGVHRRLLAQHSQRRNKPRHRRIPVQQGRLSRRRVNGGLPWTLLAVIKYR